MEIRPIKTEKDYEKSLERLEEIFDAKSGSKEIGRASCRERV